MKLSNNHFLLALKALFFVGPMINNKVPVAVNAGGTICVDLEKGDCKENNGELNFCSAHKRDKSVVEEDVWYALKHKDTNMFARLQNNNDYDHEIHLDNSPVEKAKNSEFVDWPKSMLWKIEFVENTEGEIKIYNYKTDNDGKHYGLRMDGPTVEEGDKVYGSTKDSDNRGSTGAASVELKTRPSGSDQCNYYKILIRKREDGKKYSIKKSQHGNHLKFDQNYEPGDAFQFIEVSKTVNLCSNDGTGESVVEDNGIYVIRNRVTFDFVTIANIEKDRSLIPRSLPTTLQQDAEFDVDSTNIDDWDDEYLWRVVYDVYAKRFKLMNLKEFADPDESNRMISYRDASLDDDHDGMPDEDVEVFAYGSNQHPGVDIMLASEYDCHNENRYKLRTRDPNGSGRLYTFKQKTGYYDWNDHYISGDEFRFHQVTAFQTYAAP